MTQDLLNKLVESLYHKRGNIDSSNNFRDIDPRELQDFLVTPSRHKNCLQGILNTNAGFLKIKLTDLGIRYYENGFKFDKDIPQEGPLSIKVGSNPGNISQADFSENIISIILNKEIFKHVKTLLESAHYFNAVEESYKIVRAKLKSITGEEQAHKGFKEENYKVIFGYTPQSEAQKDFCEGVKFLHMAIQNLRNEKSHTPANELDKNLAIHYIVLASLAYDLINTNNT